MVDTREDSQLCKRFIFQPCDIDAEITPLTLDQKKTIATVLAQKIAFEAVFRPSNQQKEPQFPDEYYRAPSFVSYICCCCYPEHYQDVFGITTKLFMTRIFRAILFWRDDFLEISNELESNQNREITQNKEITQNRESKGKSAKKAGVDLYGSLWLLITYILLLSLAANLFDFFQHGSSSTIFHFHPEFLTQAFAINFMFRILQILLYPSIIGCLNGQLSHTECGHLVGYGLLLYLVPTALCSLNSASLHTILLLVAALTRGIFLGRNFGSRILNRGFVIYFIVVGAEALYYLTVHSTFFPVLTAAAKAHLVTAPTITSTTVASSTPAKVAHTLLSRVFQHQ